MRIVVADAGPLHYLVLIDAIRILPRLFERVLVPEIVRDELSRARTPQPVGERIMSSPAWCQVVEAPAPLDRLPLPSLDAGERAAIS